MNCKQHFNSVLVCFLFIKVPQYSEVYSKRSRCIVVILAVINSIELIISLSQYD